MVYVLSQVWTNASISVVYKVSYAVFYTLIYNSCTPVRFLWEYVVEDGESSLGKKKMKLLSSLNETSDNLEESSRIRIILQGHPLLV